MHSIARRMGRHHGTIHRRRRLHRLALGRCFGKQGKKVRVIDNFSSGREEFLSHHLDGGSVEIFNEDLLIKKP